MWDNIIKQLIEDEGLELKPYSDNLGNFTIGIGRNLEGKGLSKSEMLGLIYGDPDRKERISRNPEQMDGKELLLKLIKDFQQYGITKEEAVWLCKNDVEEAHNSLKKSLSWFENAPQELKEILINMCFNMGIGYPPVNNKRGRGLLSFTETLKLMSMGQYDASADSMEKSLWYRQTKSRAKRLISRLRNI